MKLKFAWDTPERFIFVGILNSVGESEREESLLRDLCFVSEKYIQTI